MKILLFTDLHMCPRASIINKWGVNYPSRLENCITSVNWLERLAEEQSCDYIINLGDFFDKPDLPSETITACTEIKWSNIPHYHLVGNHDASTSSLEFNSVNSLSGVHHTVVDKPWVLNLHHCEICFLPYVVECERKRLDEYFPRTDMTKPRVIISHNDISGIQLGPIMSKTGFSLEEIETSCDLFLNGHLHNGQALTPKVVNLGNLTGKDFGENAFIYTHNVVILDTETLKLEFIENPFAFNFYKIQIEKEAELTSLRNLKNNAVVSIKCDSSILEQAKQLVETLPNIIESRLIIVKKYEECVDNTEIDLSVDHLARFIECCKANMDTTVLLEEELNEVCK